jgi:hypothetical protein
MQRFPFCWEGRKKKKKKEKKRKPSQNIAFCEGIFVFLFDFVKSDR